MWTQAIPSGAFKLRRVGWNAGAHRVIYNIYRSADYSATPADGERLPFGFQQVSPLAACTRHENSPAIRCAFIYAAQPNVGLIFR